MKYWNELTAVESESIRLECLLSLLRTVAHGAENVDKETLVDCIWHMEGTLEDINGKLRAAFNQTWDAVAEDETLATDEDVVYNFEPLETVMSQWTRKQ